MPHISFNLAKSGKMNEMEIFNKNSEPQPPSRIKSVAQNV